MAPASSEYEALVVGTGPAGSALALALATRGLRVALVGAARPLAVARQVGETVSGIFRSTLRELGVLDDFMRQGHREAYERRSVWGSDTVNERSSMVDPHGPGFHLDRAAFDAWLLEHARRAGASLLPPSRLGGIERLAAGFRLRRSEGPALEAPWLIDATGATAWVSRRLGAIREYSQRLVGVARWFDACRPESYMLVEASQHGWHYSAPLPDGSLVVMWITDARSRTARIGQSLAAWNANLEPARLTCERIGTGKPLGEATTRLTGPALTRLPRRCPGFLAVGDAALGFDPVSGDGLTFALRSALEAAQVIAAGHLGHGDLLSGYWQGLQQVYADHLSQRARLYGMERRFADSPFWLGAQGGGLPPVS